MIRVFKENDISVVMQIWLDTNIKTHSFISKCYWMDNYDMVKRLCHRQKYMCMKIISQIK